VCSSLPGLRDSANLSPYEGFSRNFRTKKVVIYDCCLKEIVAQFEVVLGSYPV
jgi:hypothetical protein